MIKILEDLVTSSLRIDNQENPREVIDIVAFSQTWGNTALGFNGVGGDAMTPAITTIVYKTGGIADVFFAGRKAYSCKVNEAFQKDVTRRCMASVNEKSKYE